MTLVRYLLALAVLAGTAVGVFAWRSRRSGSKAIVLPPPERPSAPVLPATPAESPQDSPEPTPEIPTPRADRPDGHEEHANPATVEPLVPNVVEERSSTVAAAAPRPSAPLLKPRYAPPAGASATAPDVLQGHRARRGWTTGTMVTIVVVCYVLLAVLYALRTPIWQSPDEPAHFNYVRHVAEGHGIPVLQVGDWDAAYLERLKAEKFPPELSIDSVRYESHQPPLYYVLVSPAYLLSQGLPLGIRVVLLRLVTVLISAGSLIVAYRVFATIFPQSKLLQVGVPAFIGLIPQRAHISASVNNDALAELVLGLVILASVRFLRAASPVGKASPRWIVLLGALGGVALLTKTTVYGAVVIVPMAMVLANRPLTQAILARRFGDAAEWLGSVVRSAGLALAVALLVGGWWFVRNVIVYGGFDILGLARHDQVVVGQPLAQPLWEWLPTFIQVTFQSFWLQFGWMAVPANPYVYGVLAVLTVLAIGGAWLFWQRVRRGHDWVAKAAMGLLTLALLIVVAQLVQYNLRYEQPQGRYLFPAIIPIAIFFVGGLAEVASLRPRGVGSASLMALAGALLALLVQQNVPRTTSPFIFAALLVPAGVAVLLAVLEVIAPRRSGTEPDLGIGLSLLGLLGLNVLSIVALLPYLYRP